jgi:hypothetical protein
MDLKKRIKIAFVLNLLIFVVMFFGAICSIFDFNFMTTGTHRFSPDFSRFKYFTLDSNILAGIISLIMAINQGAFLRGKKSDISKNAYVLKLMGGTGIALTMLVTVFYLAPRSEFGFFHLFENSNFFLHFLIPVIYLISFLVFERTDKIELRHTFVGIIPMIVYAIFYSLNVLLHLENGRPNVNYDIYGFLEGRVSLILIVLPFMILLTYFISFVLWKVNKLKNKTSNSK